LFAGEETTLILSLLERAKPVILALRKRGAA
jgi:hypothetical protein